MSPRSTHNDPTLLVPEFLEVDALCDRFEAAWHAGQRPDLASYLSRAPAGAQVPLFRNLLNLELDYRLRRGEQPDEQTYRKGFPQLADVVESVFRSQVRSPLLSSHRPSEALDTTGETKLASGCLPGEAVADRDGRGLDPLEDRTFAGYEILQMLGRGGMGVVYKARQVALNRDVALKLIRSGRLASDAELVRFQNEAEAVAQLDHPQIVPIYEVGRHQHCPFFSMKLIAGTSLDHLLGDFVAHPRASARLVAVVAEAIHHAHQRGILHRDLKPANILVDEQGQPHVTDFGLARRIDGSLEVTHSNALIGTPSYMAPEQATRERGALSTATDVYGLGTILYALLTGRAPFTATTLVETLDLVRTQSPEPPSRLNPRVPRDLEVICQKCLEKPPERRYPSALALAEDLTRWHNGEPILARPVSPVVRVGMWCRRNKALTSVAALLCLALIAGFAGVTWKWREADQQRAQTEAVNELLTRRLLAEASPEFDPLARNRTVRELLDRAAAQLGGWLDGQPEIEATVRETIGGAYLALGEFERAATHLKQAVRLDTQLHGPRSRAALRATNLWTALLDQTHRGAEAEPLLRRNRDDCRRALGPDDPITLDAAEHLGVVLWHRGQLDEAEAVLRKNVDDRRRVLRPEHPDTLRSIYVLSRLLRERGRFVEAEKLAYLYAHSIQCARGANHPDRVVALTNQGDVLRDQGKLAEAERYYRHAAVEAGRILGPEHRSTRAAEQNLAQLLQQLARHPNAP